MKEIKNSSDKNFLKKVFIKLCRIFGYEIIDQNNFSVPSLDKNIGENLSILGKKSINLPLGEVKITRKIKSLDIIFRTCMSVKMLTQNKKRVFEENKSEYTIRSINSVIKSYLNCDALKEIEVNFKIIDHNSGSDNLDKIKNLFKKNNLKMELIKRMKNTNKLL